MGIVTLVSGGIDSTLMSLMAHEEGIQLFPLFVERETGIMDCAG